MDGKKAFKAFKAVCYGVECIVFAKTASKARNITRVAAIDGGWEVEFMDIRVIRAPEFDEGILLDGGIASDDKCYDINLLEQTCSVAT